jgi:hypothetical protein
MDDKLKIFELNGRWSVGFNNTEIVAFAGPDARARAERQCSELTQLLSVAPWASTEKTLRGSIEDGTAPRPSPDKVFTSRV